MPKCTAIKNNYVIRAGGFVSNYERLKQYIESSLQKRKKVLYFKVNRNVNEEYTDISFEDFKKEVNRAYSEVVNKIRLDTERFVDTSGTGEIISVEVNYI